MQPQPRQKNANSDLDTAGKSLFDALKISFVILKIIMVVLVVVFLASGFRTVGPDERALVLRFGKIRGHGEKRLLGPGLHWIFPYPIDHIVKIPVEKKVNIPIDAFWYYETPADKLPKSPTYRPQIPQALDPVKDGYCITRGEKQTKNLSNQQAGSDYNIVHCKWQLTYQIRDAERFFKNVYVRNPAPGQNFFDVIKKSVRPFLESIVEDAVVTTMVHYTIDEARSSDYRIPKHVERLLSKKLDCIDSGIKVVSVQLTDVTWPRQVNRAFLASIQASQTRQTVINEARTYAENTLNEAAGPVAAELLAGFDNPSLTEEQKELLWDQLAGTAQDKIARAGAYRTKVVEAARADADYLHRLLPEYRKRPHLVLQKIYQDAIEYVLNNADEKMIIEGGENARQREIRVLLNRDPKLNPKSLQQQEQ